MNVWHFSLLDSRIEFNEGIVKFFILDIGYIILDYIGIIISKSSIKNRLEYPSLAVKCCCVSLPLNKSGII